MVLGRYGRRYNQRTYGKMKTRLSLLLLLLSLLCSCNQQGSTETASFITDDTVRLEMDGQRIFTYSANDCQLAYNEKRIEFRAHTDTMLDYFIVVMDNFPAYTGSQVNARILWSTTSGEKTKENITLVTRRIRGDVIWLSDESRRNAVVVRVLK